MSKKVKVEDLDGPAGYIFKKYAELRPPSWREGRPGRVGAAPVYPHIGAQWLLKYRVAEKLNRLAPTVRNQSAYTFAVIKSELIDERREETQFGFTGRKDGRNRRPRNVGLGTRVGEAGPEEARAGLYPLSRSPFPDPLAAAARAQLDEHVSHWRDGYSKPTARKHLKTGPRPDDFLIEPHYWREPPDGCYLEPWEWYPDGRWHRWHWQRGKPDRRVLRDYGQPRTAWDELSDLGGTLDPTTIEPDRERLAWKVLADKSRGIVPGRRKPFTDDWKPSKRPYPEWASVTED